MKKATFLMCRPDYYGINYEINPWMNRRVQLDPIKAVKQWEALVRIIEDDLCCEIELVKGQKGLPDMVFTANAGYVRGNAFVPSRFRYPQRQGEEPFFRKWFEERGWNIKDLPGEGFFEGCGDALPLGDTIFAGYRFRSDIGAHSELGNILGQKVISLELVKEWFYHLDTCFCPLENGDVIYFPDAFDEYARKAIEGNVDTGRLITVDEDEAATFCCNAVNLGDAVVMNIGASKLVKKLQNKGIKVFQADLSEFIKSGGSAKCLTLRLN